MSPEEARLVLDAARKGVDISKKTITYALHVTGDIDHRPPYPASWLRERFSLLGLNQPSTNLIGPLLFAGR